MLAKDLDADLLVIATDAAAVFLDWGTPQQRGIRPPRRRTRMGQFAFPAGSMGPKVEAAAAFARRRTRQGGGHRRAGGPAPAILAGTAGTRISTDFAGPPTFH